MNMVKDMTRFVLQRLKAEVSEVNNEVILTISKNYTELEPKIPSIVLVGPDLVQNFDMADEEEEEVTSGPPKTVKVYKDIVFKDMQFDIIVFAKKTLKLLPVLNSIEMNFFRKYASFEFPVDSGQNYDLDVITDLRSDWRPNLSNLRVSSGRFEIKKVKIRTDEYEEGTYATDKEIEMEVK